MLFVSGVNYFLAELICLCFSGYNSLEEEDYFVIVCDCYPCVLVFEVFSFWFFLSSTLFESVLGCYIYCFSYLSLGYLDNDYYYYYDTSLTVFLVENYFEALSSFGFTDLDD